MATARDAPALNVGLPSPLDVESSSSLSSTSAPDYLPRPLPPLLPLHAIPSLVGGEVPPDVAAWLQAAADEMAGFVLSEAGTRCSAPCRLVTVDDVLDALGTLGFSSVVKNLKEQREGALKK